ncbi:hypothetical protein L5G28_07785 [Gordonia sp. HY285]|uniref:hypothetical protein n=1 Tax=Gordonia liuliyuniae TaxID=2911517 RepID=UPI001F2F23C3|nr:hypothetical protein [Gordonia liuliyuniae]MCF8610062.1 hypothetical protein [Gordonia liuliyuniae]
MECSPYRLAAMLAAALEANLRDTRGGVPDRLAVYPHVDPAIEFCPDGMAWVGIGSIRPAAGGGRGSACAISWDVEMVVGVARCYPTEENNGAPALAAVDSASRDILDDAEAMRRAVRDAFEDEEPLVSGWQPVPPRGGVHGSKLTVSVRVGMGDYTEPRSPMMPGDPRA